MFERIKLGKTDAGLDFDLTLDPGKRLYCFVGKNGVGKTNLLNNLTRVLLSQHAAFTHSKDGTAYGGLIRSTVLGTALRHRNLILPGAIQLGADALKETGSDWEAIAVEDLADRRGPMKRLKTMVDVPIALIGTRGRGHTSPLGQESLRFVGDAQSEFLKAFEATWAAANDASLQLESVGPWIAERRLVNPGFVVGASTAPQDVSVLCYLLRELDPGSFSQLLDWPGTPDRVGIWFQDGQLVVLGTPIEKLATGYVAVIKILQETIASLAAWNRVIEREFDRFSPGLVVIDELDSHLHPQWQVGLLALLKKSFPNVTYIVATHSPLLVAQTEEGEAYELVREGNQVTSRRIGSPKDWYLADVYANAFHVAVPMTGSVPNAEGRTLIERLEALAAEVKRFTASKDPSARDAALRLATEIERDIPADDPRRRSVESLRGLVQ